MREKWCLLLLPALLHSSAEISLNLGGKTSIINHFSTDDVGAGWKASHFYSTLWKTRNLPGVPPPSSQTKLRGFNWDEIKHSPMARRCHRGVLSLSSPTAFYCFALSAPALYLFSSLFWNNGFLISQATGKSVLRASSALQNQIYTKAQQPKGYFTQFPHVSWAAGSCISCFEYL